MTFFLVATFIRVRGYAATWWKSHYTTKQSNSAAAVAASSKTTWSRRLYFKHNAGEMCSDHVENDLLHPIRAELVDDRNMLCLSLWVWTRCSVSLSSITVLTHVLHSATLRSTCCIMTMFSWSVTLYSFRRDITTCSRHLIIVSMRSDRTASLCLYDLVFYDLMFDFAAAAFVFFGIKCSTFLQINQLRERFSSRLLSKWPFLLQFNEADICCQSLHMCMDTQMSVW